MRLEINIQKLFLSTISSENASHYNLQKFCQKIAPILRNKKKIHFFNTKEQKP